MRCSRSVLGARRLAVGHSMTVRIPGAEPGRIATRFGEKLVCLDVGLANAPAAPRAALVVEDGAGYEWTSKGKRLLWQDQKPLKEKSKAKKNKYLNVFWLMVVLDIVRFCQKKKFKTGKWPVILLFQKECVKQS